MFLSMPRLSRLERDVVDAQTATIYGHLQHSRGNVPRMFKTMAHRPEVMQTAVAHLRAVLETGTVPLKLKQLMIVRTSQLNNCEY
jgi:alkylhydroperoxidase family enzyme